MKRAMRLFILAALLISLFTAQALAIDLKKGKVAEPAAATSDLSVSVRLVGEQGGVYRAGREIRFTFSTTRDAFVVVYNIDSDGYVHLLWPADGRLARTDGNRTVSVPEAGSEAHWETGDRTGIEYIHALAVVGAERIKEEELYFLAKSDEMREEKRFRVDSDPYLAFNMIDEQIVADAEQMPPATDYTYFYINREVDYPRYLCMQCHAEEKLSDPYAMECTEVVIEKSTYDGEVQYPYPPLYDIRHVGAPETSEADASDDEDEWLDEEEEDGGRTDVHLSFHYRNYDWPYYGGYLFSYYPVYWDPFWWGFGWPYYWGGFYSPGWYYSWWYPHSYWPYWGYDWRWCGGYHDGWYGHYRNRPSFGDRSVVKRQLDYRTVNARMSRDRVVAGTRIAKDRREPVGSRLERAALGRRSLARSDMNRVAPSVRGTSVTKRTVYGGAETRSGVDRSRVTKRPRTDVEARSPRSRGPLNAPGTRRARDAAVRERSGSAGRGTGTRETPATRREAPARVERETRSAPRERSHDSSTGRQRSSDSGRGERGVERRRTSEQSSSASAGRSAGTWRPQTWQPSVRSASRGSNAPSAPARSAASPPSTSGSKRR